MFLSILCHRCSVDVLLLETRTVWVSKTEDIFMIQTQPWISSSCWLAPQMRQSDEPWLHSN